VVQEIICLTDGGADWAIESIGLPGTLEQAMKCLRPGGTAVAIGLGRADEAFSIRGNRLVQGDRQIRGSLYGSANRPVDLPRILGLYGCVDAWRAHGRSGVAMRSTSSGVALRHGAKASGATAFRVTGC
jgi:hypothetical protein